MSMIPMPSLIEKNSVIHEDENVRITHIDNGSAETVIVFTYAIAEEDLSRENLALYQGSDRNILHITDIKNSWFNNFSPYFILKHISYLLEDKTVYLVGCSMGAFNAIIFSNYIKAKKCVAFSPQYSILDRGPNMSSSIGHLINKINNLKTHTVKFSSQTQYFLIFGNDSEELESSSLAIKNHKGQENIKILTSGIGKHDMLMFISRYLKIGASPIVESFINKEATELFTDYGSLDWKLF